MAHENDQNASGLVSPEALGDYLRKSLQGSGIPDYMHDGIVSFYTCGAPPGSFLSAVIDNDLFGAFRSADDVNRERIYEYLQWFCRHAPAGTWGFSGAVKKRCQRDGS